MRLAGLLPPLSGLGELLSVPDPVLLPFTGVVLVEIFNIFLFFLLFLPMAVALSTET